MKFKSFFFLICTFLLLAATSYSQTTVPPVITAIGDQYYCPLSDINIVTYFDITPGSEPIDAVFIQISQNYSNGADTLFLTNGSSHPNISASWNASEGKLKLEVINSTSTSYKDLIAAVKEVAFHSTNATISGEKSFSITIDEANYLPSTGHYYEYVPDVGITWTNAKTAAATKTHYGLQGYLATITSADEAQLTGKQAEGTGWIGASDAATEGTWKWMTGPEAGKTFWFGASNGTTTGTDIPFANWNNGEPNNLGDEDYAHITAPNVGIVGSWNDLKNTGDASGDYQPKGYIVEYGGMPGDPTLNLSGNTKITSLKNISIPNSIAPLKACDTNMDGDDTNGKTFFDLTLNEAILLNGSSNSEYSFSYFSDPSYSIPISNPKAYSNTVAYQQTIFVRVSNNLKPSCYTDTSFEIRVNQLPVIQTSITFKNCDEDGIPDGFTDFNLNEAIPIITNNDSSLMVSFYLSVTDAEMGLSANAINPFPFNNSTSNIVYARVENENGCFRIATVTLAVSTTKFPQGFNYEITSCDLDQTMDGLATFDLTEATTYFLEILPPQNLSIKYYRNLSDAQLEQHEILPQNAYLSETPYSQSLYVRVENKDNGDCFGIGKNLTLTVHPRPEFEVNPNEIVCLNLAPITLEVLNPKDTYTYKWTDDNGTLIGTQETVEVATGGNYTVTAYSTFNCESFPKTITVSESNTATITLNDITITDDSNNNSIAINTTNLGIGDYEFSLDNPYFNFQNAPFFDNVISGIHTIYVRDKNKCGTTSIQVSVIGFPKYFTPNNDGINDTWQIKGVNENFYPNSIIYIYNRFGKVIAKIDPNSNGWDGWFNGKLLPSSDYWFTAKLIDENGTIREKKGHFSLLRH